MKLNIFGVLDILKTHFFLFTDILETKRWIDDVNSRELQLSSAAWLKWILSSSFASRHLLSLRASEAFLFHFLHSYMSLCVVVIDASVPTVCSCLQELQSVVVRRGSWRGRGDGESSEPGTEAWTESLRLNSDKVTTLKMPNNLSLLLICLRPPQSPQSELFVLYGGQQMSHHPD